MSDPQQPGERTGYRNPPKSTRFKKGQSGNPRGRPRGSRKEAPYEAVLGQKVVIRENGVERTVTAAEAFLLHMSKRGLAGDGAAARATMLAIEDARERRLHTDNLGPTEIVLTYVRPGSVNGAMETLRMARKLDPYRPTARMALEPWIVEAALERLGDRRLSVEEQRTVVNATRTPWNVSWPEWWEVKSRK